ncbi:GNAT family N-acetyltransferase [Rouxiella silvae]|uniref:GNAT family N-acetyltransferase n=1 Tax=Rouxiella silvae TaxID=1646373 RepID=A0ABX3U167_9GAMM|nr:GNAT family N-acetyltransferase [Rouxiella silvae]ORJ21218.1 GNAT family N-acetyltransferase [Rouxiella silvae]
MLYPMFETERLLLNPLRSEDAIQIQQILPQWEIVQFLAASFPWPYPTDGAAFYVDKVALPAVSAGSAWFWTLRVKKSPNDIIGMISLSDAHLNNRGFWLSPLWHRQGLMSEACEVITEYWFNTLQRNVLHAPKAVSNEASRKMSIKSGMRLIRQEKKEYVSGFLDSELWEITREEWSSRHAKL